MPPVTVLITFYSRCGTTETLASSAAVGAVQQRANIRLRRVPDGDAASTLEASPDCRDALTRMHKEYVTPTEGDVLAAGAIVLVPQAGADVTSAEWADYLQVLTRLGSQGKLEGKVGAVVDAGSEPTRRAFSSALQALGVIMPPDAPETGGDAAERATEQGRRVVTLARARPA